MVNVVVNTTTKKDIIDVTGVISEQIGKTLTGMVFVNILHTTAALTTADLDPGTDLDFLDFIESLIPDVKWRHPHNPDHAPSHLLSSLIGSSVSIPCANGSLHLGEWQRIVLVELDGPRERTLSVGQIVQSGS